MQNFLSDPLYTAYMIALGLSIFISTVLISYLWSRRSVTAVLPIIGILAAIVFWATGYLLEYLNTDLSTKLFMYDIEYIGIASIPIMFLLFALQYTRHENWITLRRLLLISIIPAITVILVWTKDLHTLMYSNVSLASQGSFTIVSADYGSWFWLFVIYDYLLVVAAVALLVHRLFSYKNFHVRQIISIIIIIAAPITASLLYVFRLVPGISYVDWSGPAFLISAIGMTYLIFQQRLLDLLPIARDSAIEIMSDGYLVLDSHNYILDLNRTMQSIIGIPACEAIGRQLPELIAKQLRPDNSQSVKNEIDLNVNGELKYYRVHSSPLTKPGGKNKGYILLFYDISESKKFEQKLTAMATHDYLTGLPNRALLEDRFEVALARAKRNRAKFAVMICDLDYFKTVNDTVGHVTADKLLKSIASRLNRIMRGGDTLARAGGDEFVIILSEIATEKQIAGVAERIVKAFNKPFVVDGEEINISVSVGISIYPDNGEKMGTLLKNADTAMYRVKNSGGANFLIYSNDEQAL